MPTREKEMLVQFKTAKTKRDLLKEELKNAQQDVDHLESDLITLLEDKQATATAKYDGIGYAQLQTPRLYANCNKDEMERLFAFLKTQQREDLIKTTVMPQSLSTFAKECLENGIELPDCISYYLKPQLRLYA